MANVSGQIDTVNLVNFVGELFNLTGRDAPLKTLAAANGVRRVQSKQFTWQTTDNATAAQPDIAEGQDPTFAGRDRAEVSNVVQIFQYGVEVAYSKLGNIGMLGSGGETVATPAISVLGDQPVSNEIEFQQALKLDRCAEDMEESFLNGTFDNPDDTVTGRRTRGVSTAITTNSVSAGTSDLSRDHIDELLRDMHSNRARFVRPTIMGGAIQIQRVNEAYEFVPRDRTVGGANIRTIITPFGELDVVINRHVTSTELLILDLAVIKPVVMPIPGKGELFLEPVARTGAAEKSQLYGEWGVQYGPEQWHGKITALTTS
jgi:hypothetical protein